MLAGSERVSAPADAGVAADPQREVSGISGRLDDLVLGHAGHGRACDRTSEPVPGLDELVLRPLVRLEGQGQSVRCHARSMAAASPDYTIRSAIRVASAATATRIRPAIIGSVDNRSAFATRRFVVPTGRMRWDSCQLCPWYTYVPLAFTQIFDQG